MKGTLRVVRGNEVKLTLPGPSITQKPDGTLWMSGNPLLGITDAAEKTRCANLIRAHGGGCNCTLHSRKIFVDASAA
jgi:hypothetical protein